MRAGTCAAVLALLLPAALVPGAPAAAAAAPRVAVVPQGPGLVRSGDGLDLDVAVSNPGPAALPAGSVGVGLDPAPPSGVANLADRLAHPSITGYLVATAKTPAVAPGHTEHVRVRVPAATVHGTIGPRSGARLVNAALSAGGSPTAIGAAAVTYLGGQDLPGLGFTAVLPLTAPAGTTGLVTDPAVLSALVAPDGEWGRALAAAQAAPGVVLALDPAVLASIRLAGSAAPEEVRSFLDDLRSLPNEQLELPYADGDLTLQRAAGAHRALAPTSFRNALTTPAPAPSEGPSPSPTRTPSASATAAAAPATLLDWQYSAPKVAWPVAGTVTPQDLAFDRTSGYRATLLAGSNVRDTPARAKAGPHARIGSSDVLVADAAASALLTAAADGQAGALSSLVAMLATDATSGAARDVLLTVDRSGAGAGAARVLRVLAGQSWLHADRLRDLVGTTSPAPISLARAVATPRADRAHDLLAAEAAVRRLGTALQDPAAITGPERLALLGLLSSAWRRTDADWSRAASDGIRRFHRVVAKVRIDQGSSVNYIGGSGALPITIINSLDQPVTVVLHGSPNNSRLTVEGTRRATVPPESSLPVSLPVRSISNGQVALRVSITTTGGWEISHRTVEINVAAGWETVGALVFGLGLAALLGTGLYRNLVVRRRKDRRS